MLLSAARLLRCVLSDGCRAVQNIYGRKQRSVTAAEGSPEDGGDVLSERQFADVVLSAKGGCPAFTALHAAALPADAA